jgi:hypothetical protein
MSALVFRNHGPQVDAALRGSPADLLAIPEDRRQAKLREFKRLGDALIADLDARRRDARERGRDLESALRDIRREERQQEEFILEVERFRSGISNDAHRPRSDFEFLEEALRVDQAVLNAYRACRQELETLRRQRLDEYSAEWLAYLQGLKERPEYAALAPRIEEFWLWVSEKLWAPEATPTDDGFLLIWDRDEHHLQVELFHDGSYDWFYRNRDRDTVSYEEGLPYGRWTPRFQEAISALRG